MLTNSRRPKLVRALHPNPLPEPSAKELPRSIGSGSPHLEGLEDRVLLSVIPALTEPDTVAFVGLGGADALYLRARGELVLARTGVIEQTPLPSRAGGTPGVQPDRPR